MTEPEKPAKRNRARVLPQVTISCFCDRVIFDAMTHVPSLIGIYNQCFCAEFPSVLFPSIYTSMTNGRGTVPTKMRLYDPVDNATLFEYAKDIEFPDPLTQCFVSNNRIPVTVEHAGTYILDTLVHDELAATRHLFVRHAELQRVDAKLEL